MEVSKKTLEIYRIFYEWSEFEPRSWIDAELLYKHMKRNKYPFDKWDCKFALNELYSNNYLLRKKRELYFSGKYEFFYSLVGDDENLYKIWKEKHDVKRTSTENQ